MIPMLKSRPNSTRDGLPLSKVILGTLFLVFLAFLVFAVYFVIKIKYFWDSPEMSNEAVLVDLDADGDLDAVLANGKNEGQVANTVWINQGGAQAGIQGEFVAVDQPQPWGIANSNSVAVGDLDGDGDFDAVVGNDGFSGIFLNQGGMQGGEPGNFKETSRGIWHDFMVGLWSVALGDLDADDDLDIWVAVSSGGFGSSDAEEWFWLPAHNLVAFNDENEPDWDSNLRFRDSGQLLGVEGSEEVALGDLDGDGDLDAFVANSASIIGVSGKRPQEGYDQPDQVWLNDGNGYFTDSGQQLGAAESFDAALGDLDGDGDLDALVLGRQEGFVWQNDGIAVFSPGMQMRLNDGIPRSLHLGDLDGDGDLDAIMGWKEEIQVWLNDGQARFEISYPSYTHPEHFAIAPGDLDGDGDIDLFAGKLAEQTIVWLNDGQANFMPKQKSLPDTN
jgi:hypothetical protein